MDNYCPAFIHFFFLSLLFAVVSGSVPPQPTAGHVPASSAVGFSPVPTEAPYLMGFSDTQERQDLRRVAARQQNIETCAYVSGIQASSLTCAPGMACAINVGGQAGCCQAGNFQNCILPTTCVPYRNLGYCNAYCANNPYILKCNAAYPECYTLAVVFPGTTYYQQNCWTVGGAITALNSYTDRPGAASVPVITPVTVTAAAVVASNTPGSNTNTNTNNNNNVNNINLNMGPSPVADAGKKSEGAAMHGRWWVSGGVVIGLLFVIS